MDSVTLQEISRRSIVLNKNVETTVCWHHAPLSVLTDRGLHLLDFSHDIHCYDKKIDTLEYSLLCPSTSPASQLFPPDFTQKTMHSMDYNQMLIDPALWPHNPDLMEEIANFASYTWSPPGFIYNCECVLATVTNMGNIELFGRERLGWESILRLSDEIEPLYDIQTITKVSTKLKEIRQSALAVQSCAFCWGTSSVDNSIYFVTAQKNGDLLFWTLNVDEKLKANFVAKISIDTCEIVSIHWVTKTDETIMIIYSNILGQVYSLQCEIKNNTICLNKSICLWHHNDRMIVKHLKYVIEDKKIVLLYVKHRHLVVQVLSDNEINSQCFQNINENRITGLTMFDDNFYLFTVNCKIYKVKVKIANGSVSIDLLPIPLKDSYPTYDLYGFSISNNGVLFALAMVDRKVMYRKEPLTVSVIFLIEEDKQTELTKLISNPTRNLCQVWDCVELIRYKTVKFKTLPAINLNEFYAESQSDIYKMKIYLIFLMLYRNLEKVLWLNANVSLPEMSIEKVKATILFNHAQNVLDKLFKKYQLSDHKLSDFEMETFASSKKYLEYYCLQYNSNLADLVNVDIFDIIQTSEIKQICDYCDENLEGLSCKKGHLNIFCSVTFTQIQSTDYAFCSKCSAVARIELKPLKPSCTFCGYGLNVF